MGPRAQRRWPDLVGQLIVGNQECAVSREDGLKQGALVEVACSERVVPQVLQCERHKMRESDVLPDEQAKVFCLERGER